MDQCDIVEKQHQKRLENRDTHHASDENTFQFKNNPFSVFSGILPGNLQQLFIHTRLCAPYVNGVCMAIGAARLCCEPASSIQFVYLRRLCCKAIMCFCDCYSQVQSGAEQVCVVGQIERIILQCWILVLIGHVIESSSNRLHFSLPLQVI